MGIIEEGAGVSGSEERKQFVEGKYQEFLEEYKEVIDTHLDQEPVVIFEIDFSNIEGESVINEDNANIDGLGKCEIIIFKSEGDNIPHFHILSKKDDVVVNGRKKQFDGCIKLYKAEFWPHAGHVDTFKDLKGKTGKKAAKSLNKFLSEKDKATGKQRWEVLRDRWLDEFEHKDVRHIRDIDKPNYNNLV